MLTPRQQHFYTDRANLYKPIISQDGKVLSNPVYPDTPTLSDVPCKYYSTPNLEIALIQGRTKQFNIFTSDVWHFAADCPIDDTWAIELVTVGHPQYGMWSFVEGDSQVRVSAGMRKANKAEVYAKPGPVPKNIAALRRGTREQGLGTREKPAPSELASGSEGVDPVPSPQSLVPAAATGGSS